MPKRRKTDDDDSFEGFESSDDGSQASDTADVSDRQLEIISSEKSATSKSAKQPKPDQTGEPTVIYLGYPTFSPFLDESMADVPAPRRIPHGFHEQEMRAYFGQFGDIARLRLSRSKKTGASKHYAFIQFAEPEVAKIVAQTMDRYLMFGHILRCRLVPPAQVHADLWKGANRRFKVMPRNRIEGSKLKAGTGRDAWKKRIRREEERREGKKAKLLKMGYEYEPPKLVGVDEVKRLEAPPEPEAGAATDEIAMVEATHT